jgi:hypothetical protein
MYEFNNDCKRLIIIQTPEYDMTGNPTGCDEEPYCESKGEYFPDCLICECPEIIGLKKNGGENRMAKLQQVFDSTDYGEMTLAQLGPEGVEFLLQKVEPTEGKWGQFAVLLGKKDGSDYEIRAGGRTGDGFMDKASELEGKIISIIPRGTGMDRKYTVSIVNK